MKTILAIFSNSRITEIDPNKFNFYSFNTEADLKVGDRIRTSTYNKPIQVVEIKESTSEFYLTLPNGEKIKTKELVIVDNPDIVFGKIIEKEEIVI